MAKHIILDIRRCCESGAIEVLVQDLLSRERFFIDLRHSWGLCLPEEELKLLSRLRSQFDRKESKALLRRGGQWKLMEELPFSMTLLDDSLRILAINHVTLPGVGLSDVYGSTTFDWTPSDQHNTVRDAIRLSKVGKKVDFRFVCESDEGLFTYESLLMRSRNDNIMVMTGEPVPCSL